MNVRKMRSYHRFLGVSNNLLTLGANKPTLRDWLGLFESVH